jgi:hypothetical protein
MTIFMQLHYMFISFRKSHVIGQKVGTWPLNWNFISQWIPQPFNHTHFWKLFLENIFNSMFEVKLRIVDTSEFFFKLKHQMVYQVYEWDVASWYRFSCYYRFSDSFPSRISALFLLHTETDDAILLSTKVAR